MKKIAIVSLYAVFAGACFAFFMALLLKSWVWGCGTAVVTLAAILLADHIEKV